LKLAAGAARANASSAITRVPAEASRPTGLQPRNVVYVIGRSGVGKSTLINALIEDGFGPLPQGGIGPLTALKVQVRHATAPYFRVRYKPVTFAQELLASLRSAVPNDRDLRLVRHLIEGSPFGQSSPATLAARLEEAMVGGGTEVAEGSVSQVLRGIRDGQLTSTMKLRGNSRAFVDSLSQHSAGHLATLVDEMEVGWDSPLLRNGVWLLDLPGTGVERDVFVDVTRRELRAASTVLFVVDRSGVDEGTIRVLRETGFLDRLLEGIGGHHRARLIVAVVALDQPTTDRVKELKASQSAGVSWRREYLAVSEAAVRVVRGQLKSVIGVGEPRRHRPAAPDIEVLAALPRDHQRLHAKDEEDRARVDAPEDTGLPALRSILATVVDDAASRVVAVTREGRAHE